ncbi:glycosyltransferase [Humidesulfovibrio sp.]
MRVVMSIPSLAPGGAERQFAALAAGLAAHGHEVLAVTLGKGGALAAELGAARLVELGKTSRWDNLRVGLALAGLLRRHAPHIHYAFLPSCCVLGALVAPLCPRTRLVFGIRAADPGGLGCAGRLLLRLEAQLARRSRLVIANSHAGRELCLARGFPPRLLHVVDNGIDTDRFRPDTAAGADLRASWGVTPQHRLIGLVARLDPLKDHATFLEAAAMLAAQRADARFVCVGGGGQKYAQTLRQRAESLGLAERLVWAGEQADMPAVYSALDVACLSSASEAFPNALGEAMSCGVPCVATSAGDAARVLGGAGLAVPPGDATALAAGLAQMLGRLEREGEALGRLCRARVETEFSLPRMVAGTQALFEELLRK